MADKKYIVAARVDNEKDCLIAPQDAMIMATHRVVFDRIQRKIAKSGKALIVSKNHLNK